MSWTPEAAHAASTFRDPLIRLAALRNPALPAEDRARLEADPDVQAHARLLIAIFDKD